MQKFLLLLVEEEAAYNAEGAASFDEVMLAHREFAAAVRKAGGTIESSEALQPVSTATFLRGTRTAQVSAIDNPLPEAKEVVGGYYLVEVPDAAVAKELAALCPAPYGYVEMRPIWDVSAPAS